MVRHVSSACFRVEQEDSGQKTAYRPRYPRQGGDQLSLCLHKAAQWLLAAPLNMAWTVQGARGGRQLPPPTPVDRCHYPTKTKSTEEFSLQLSALFGCRVSLRSKISHVQPPTFESLGPSRGTPCPCNTKSSDIWHAR
jgi:hypothetical protein